MRWAGHVARVGGRIGAYRVLVGRIDGKRDHLGHLAFDGTIILRWIFRKWDVGVWIGSIWLRIGTAQYFSGDKIEKNEMGGACSACGGEERCIQSLGGET